MQIRDIGEQGLLAKLQKFCPPEVIGDDGAILTTTPGTSLVVTTDILVDGVHFSDRTTTPFDVGWRAAAANLSDLAAMGAVPLGITVGLCLPPDLAVSWVEALYEGLTSCLEISQTPIVGGDICRSSQITVAITAFGEVDPNFTIRRHAAKVGDVLLATGIHGASKAGLELLLNPKIGANLSALARESLIKAHQQPNPRLDVLPHLQELYANSTPVTIAGMDSSDGLADAVLQICRASSVGAMIEMSQLPIAGAIAHLVSAPEALNWTLYGGEDFELILSLPVEKAQLLVEQLGNGATIFGKIIPGTAVKLVDSQGHNPEIILTLDRGFQHFR
ncbi:thiamine-phosphate kinase [Merismopedia glauca]|uniref:Thiamine-monophosphate kinase n=1 Tax=Merismopedia glauca CCAP 1448/3 TaxID=1296344 RepID=A0A2T1C8V4_9CYAN|nr:thiamine-phosphate kinase [Merismopedia glauca]PSB04577.1 thiamine-phosphate kinase [Merismopedia glauca CCAP 1448/3]